ncbi:MAG: glycoside hydrolase family 27 protein [Lachnospiraceae bacterium]|nr:glycoside hydrolase family 27 protein [Lachnospiraceae bacterium]
MKKNFLTSPPMGWNSYDYYDTTVTEADVKANADYMAANLKEYGWEYVVVDIEWYSYNTGTRRNEHQYIPFEAVEMDEYSRLLPCPQRFPSAVNGAGFKPLADYVHNLGLKFGIHIMRGIPRIAAHTHTKIKGTDVPASEIAVFNNICWWNPDMYGVDPNKDASQIYYNSLLDLYAEWGVDFIKVDDICRMDAPTAEKEIIMLHNAINQCGRDIVLSLSPGPAKIDKAWCYERYANMWRITDDFWDNWPLLLNMFERCELWERHVSDGSYPDCDMLPIGKIGKGFFGEHDTNFTMDEQITMMSLWCMFKSPMMIGAELTKLDDETLSLLTNKDILGLLKLRNQARQLVRNKNEAVWMNTDDNYTYIELFNLSDDKKEVSFDLSELGIKAEKAEELWTKENVCINHNILISDIPAHGAAVYRI